MSDALSPEALKPDDPSPILHSVVVVVAAFLFGFLLAGVAASLIVAAGVASDPQDVALYVPVSALQFVGFGVIVVAYLETQSRWSLVRLSRPSLRDIGWTVGGFVVLFASVYAIGIVLTLLDQQTAENAVVTAGQQNPTLFLYMIPITIFFVAPAEEFLFRGVVQGLFRRAYGPVVAVLVASAMFGVAHVVALQGGGKAAYIAVAAALGLVLGAVYERTDNILVPIGVHGLWNAFLFGIQWLAATGAVPAG